MGSSPVVLRILAYLTFITWLFFEARQSAQHRADARVADDGSRRILGACYLFGILAAALIHAKAPSGAIGDAALSTGIGLFVLWCGLALRLWSFKTLGRYFTFDVQTSDDQPVITSGPYRFVRHPSYAGLLLAFIGVGLLFANWWSLLATTAFLLLGLVNRIRVEERALSKDLGGRYQSYARSRKRLIPFVW